MNMHVSDGSVVVVTGAAGGIGAAVAAKLAPGARALTLWDLDPRVHRVAEEIGERNACTVRATEVDVTDSNAIATAFDEVTTQFGPADVVAHAAGIVDSENALELSPQAWERCLAINATGVVHVTQRAARDMVNRGHGAIVVVSSNAASAPRVGMAAYGASKAAASAFTRALALQVAPHGVRVNLVSPGSTDTAMLRSLHAEDGEQPLDDNARTNLLDGDPDAYRLGIPLQRIAAAEDIAAAVRFLASEDARHITMHDLRVDGGATLDM